MKHAVSWAEPWLHQNEFWFVRLSLWRPAAIIYGVLVENLVELRAGQKASPNGRARYDDILVPMLALAAAARAPVAILSVVCFGLSFVRSQVLGPGPQDWLDVAGLALGWSAALGMATSIARMGVQRVLRRRVRFLMRTRLAEPRNGDIVWQLAVGLAAAGWWHLH